MIHDHDDADNAHVGGDDDDDNDDLIYNNNFDNKREKDGVDYVKGNTTQMMITKCCC